MNVLACLIILFNLASTKCNPQKCGPYSNLEPDCSCICQEGYIGQPPNCRPECILNSDCLAHQTCDNDLCIDPCENACGENTDCKVIRHRAVCSCKSGAIGDPYVKCTIDDHSDKVEEVSCLDGVSCGMFSQCDVTGKCTCLEGYFGQPPLCQPQCLRNSDCLKDQACINSKCRDSCTGACGTNAQCNVLNHIPKCTCPKNFNGDPYDQCFQKPIEQIEDSKPIGIDNPNAEDEDFCNQCASNSECVLSLSNQKTCKCLQGYIGDPHVGCRPECILNTECPGSKACINQRCSDPCKNTCGPNARCSVVNHFTICTCEPGYTGDPFQQCTKTCMFLIVLSFILHT